MTTGGFGFDVGWNASEMIEPKRADLFFISRSNLSVSGMAKIIPIGMAELGYSVLDYGQVQS